MRACTSPNSLANLLQESPASVLQKTSPLTLLASRKSGSAACVARFQIVPLGASGNGRVSQVCPRSRERCSAPRPPKALSPLPRYITWGSSALTSTPRQYGMETWLLTCTGSQVAPLSVLEKISRGVIVNNVFGGPTVMARLWNRPPANSLPRQISIDGQVLTRCPAGSFFGGFRTPAFLPGHRSRRAGIRNPNRSRTLAEVGAAK